jgi:signal transduction histidine kinase
VYAEGQFAVEANLLTKDGRRIPHYFTGLTVDYAGSQCLMGVGIDLSAVKTLEKELSQQKIAQQKKIMQAMIRAEEKEKNKLGLELHDNVNQILSVVRMYLTILDSENKMEEVTLGKTIQLLNSAIDEIRHLSHSLAVSYKFEAGLVDALEDMVEKISVTRDFSINLCPSDDLDLRTNNEQKLAIYRIVQEQLNNVIKYAKATEVKVEIQTSADVISLIIQDNGQGFNPAKAGKGLGLSNITTRAESLEGKVCIYSAPGKGCRMTVTLPLNVEMVEEEG